MEFEYTVKSGSPGLSETHGAKSEGRGYRDNGRGAERKCEARRRDQRSRLSVGDVRPWLQLYPEEKGGFISVPWNAEKWLKETNLNSIAPMAICQDPVRLAQPQHSHLPFIALSNLISPVYSTSLHLFRL